MSAPLPPMYQDPSESWSDKAQRKFKENPWVPLGCLATTGALVMSAIKMRQGQSKTMNYWLRARVALQGATLVALVGGSMSLQKARKERLLKEAADAEAGFPGGLSGAFTQSPADTEGVKLTGEQMRQREVEKREFAERMRAAEMAAEMEAGAGLSGMRTVKGPVVKEKENK
ncbi:hypothetical protein BDN70DRAFT_870988 [Pholiota conissans]|uniref:HIG1 domain-containing protein n=1 Tax=Pholiota conissans TaxID=109636 RepID=A0A9P6D7H0_9AGAR|nr:hypothetical protein BDN70DRAFT_870988 [Pholiota conissans]